MAFRRSILEPLHWTLLAAIGLSTQACGPGTKADAGDDAGTADADDSDGDADSDADTDADADADADADSDDDMPGDLPASEVCAGAQPVALASGEYSGYDQCPDKTIHRVMPVPLSPMFSATSCMGDEMNMSCTADTDCTANGQGMCAHFGGGFDNPETACGCIYACTSDAECGDGSVCVPPGVVPLSSQASQCVTAACLTGEDCASGECGISSYDTGCYPHVALQCRAAGDACRLDADCEGQPGGSACALPEDSTTVWGCTGPNCAIGRPLMVAGAPRVAGVCDAVLWSRASVAGQGAEALAPALRSVLAHHWAQIGALEHASVASFARHTLELMQVGAPPELLADVQRAAADEVRHAELTFALAERYGDRPSAPGPIELGDLVLERDPAAIARALVVEGCVGETIGAAEAQLAAARCEDEAVRAVLEEIASDELRHAQLAWRTLRWLVERLSPEARRSVARSAELELARLHAGVEPSVQAMSSLEPAHARTLARHGVVFGTDAREDRRAAIETLVRPTLRAIFGAGEAARDAAFEAVTAQIA